MAVSRSATVTSIQIRRSPCELVSASKPTLPRGSVATIASKAATAVAQVGSTATTNAIAEAGAAGQTFANPGQTAYVFSAGSPDKSYVAGLVGSATDVAGALLGTRDKVFGTAILGGNYATDGGGEQHDDSATSTFDFGSQGDLSLGLIDYQSTGSPSEAGFDSIAFTVAIDGSRVLSQNFSTLSDAEAFFQDNVIDLGTFRGPVDVSFSYDL